MKPKVMQKVYEQRSHSIKGLVLDFRMNKMDESVFSKPRKTSYISFSSDKSYMYSLRKSYNNYRLALNCPSVHASPAIIWRRWRTGRRGLRRMKDPRRIDGRTIFVEARLIELRTVSVALRLIGRLVQRGRLLAQWILNRRRRGRLRGRPL